MMCNTVREVVDHLERIVEVVLVAEEALYGKNVLVLRTGWAVSRNGLINPLSC
jgi:hypothetical protein